MTPPNTYMATNCQCVEKAMVEACPVHDFGEPPLGITPVDQPPDAEVA